MSLSRVLSIGAWSSGVLSLIALGQRHVGVSLWRCLGNSSAALLATPEARRSVLVSLWRPQLRRWCGFRGKGRLNLPGHGSTKFARPLRCFLLLCCHLLRLDDSCRNRRQIDLLVSLLSGGNTVAKGLAFVLFVPRLIFD